MKINKSAAVLRCIINVFNWTAELSAHSMTLQLLHNLEQNFYIIYTFFRSSFISQALAWARADHKHHKANHCGRCRAQQRSIINI